MITKHLVLLILSFLISFCVSIQEKCQNEGGKWSGDRCKTSAELREEEKERARIKKEKLEANERNIREREKIRQEEIEREDKEREERKKLLKKELFLRFKDNKNGTVTDLATKKIWQKCLMGQNRINCKGEPSNHNWEDAIIECKILKLGNKKKWKLPSVSDFEEIHMSNTEERYSFVDIPAFASKAVYPLWSSLAYKIRLKECNYRSKTYYTFNCNTDNDNEMRKQNYSNYWNVEFSFVSEMNKSNEMSVRCVSY